MLEWFTKGKNLQSLGTLLGGLGGLYGNYLQGKQAKGLINLQKSAYARGIKRQDDADKNLQIAYDSSTMARKKPKALVKL